MRTRSVRFSSHYTCLFSHAWVVEDLRELKVAMAVRMLTYVGLLYQDLIRRKLVAADGRLPPVLPVVLYNGDPPWRAARDVASLVEAGPAGLERYRPRLEYFLLDEGRIAGSELEHLRTWPRRCSGWSGAGTSKI